MMRRRLTGLSVVAVASAVLGLPIGAAAKPVPAKEPKVTAAAAVVMDARTGELLWSHHPDEPRAPASTTKILTTVLALESGRLDEPLRVSSQAQAQVPSKLYLRTGQTAKLRDLLYALMLKSANDAAVVVAEGLAGSVEEFGRRMTARARAMGARSSQFRNPSGLPDPEHVSTARDLGHILRHAVRVPGFIQVASVTSQRIPIASGKKTQWMVLRTKNRLLEGYTVPVIGKTGFTRAAGRCFAGYAEKDGRALVVVVLGARDLWGDTRTLFDWGFAQPVPEPLPVPVQVASRPLAEKGWRSADRAARRAEPAKEPVPERAPAPPAERPAVVEAAAVAAVPPALEDELAPAHRAAAPAPAVVNVSHAPPQTPPARVRAPLPAARPADDRRSDERARSAAGLARRSRSDLPMDVASRPAAQPAPRAAARAAALAEPSGRVILAMGNGSSTAGGRTYYGEYRSSNGMVRRGCTGSGCEQRAGSGRR